MEPYGMTSILLAIVFASYLSIRAVKRKSLTKNGAIAAWFVGFFSVASGLRGFLLFFFYLIGTRATKFRKELKQKRDESAVTESTRDASQVLACSAIAVVCSCLHVYFCGKEQKIDFENYHLASILTCAVLAHYSCCCGDTLASEMGILSSNQPILVIAPWRKVPHGTNGGISIMGTIWSGLGGVFMGIGMLAMDFTSGILVKPFETVGFGFVCGLLGSLIDSILGATLQVTYYDKEQKIVCKAKVANSCVHISGYEVLSNVQVNILSTLLTTILGGILIGPMIFS